MAEIETITILKVGTEEAVQSIGDLKNNIKLLKKDLDDLEIGTQEYQDTLDELKVNQNALKDAMYATSSSMEDLAEAATGTSESYNSLVHRMAAYKEELRTVDTSTEAGMQRFKELAAQVKGVNDRLKELDAMQGNYQRNVGSYEVALKNFHNVVKDLPPSMNAVKKAGDQLDKSFAIMSVNPIIGVITLVAPLINKIADGLKDNEKATAALQKALKAQISTLKGLPAENIFLGNGSDEAIDLCFRVFCTPGVDNAVAISPSYGMYTVAAGINDVAVRSVPLGPGFSLPARALLDAADAHSKLLFLCRRLGRPSEPPSTRGGTSSRTSSPGRTPPRRSSRASPARSPARRSRTAPPPSRRMPRTSSTTSSVR